MLPGAIFAHRQTSANSSAGASTGNDQESRLPDTASQDADMSPKFLVDLLVPRATRRMVRPDLAQEPVFLGLQPKQGLGSSPHEMGRGGSAKPRRRGGRRDLNDSEARQRGCPLSGRLAATSPPLCRGEEAWSGKIGKPLEIPIPRGDVGGTDRALSYRCFGR